MSITISTLIYNSLPFIYLYFFYCLVQKYKEDPDLLKSDLWNKLFDYTYFDETKDDIVVENPSSEIIKKEEPYEQKYLEKFRSLIDDEKHMKKDICYYKMNAQEYEIMEKTATKLRDDEISRLEKLKIELETQVLTYITMMVDRDKFYDYLNEYEYEMGERKINDLMILYDTGNFEYIDNIILKNKEEIDQIDEKIECLKMVVEVCVQDNLEEEYNVKAREMVIKERLKGLKNNIIMEKTQLGNVIMYYDCEAGDGDGAFVYYSDNTIPYRFLEVVGRKYAITFNCCSLYCDMEKVVKEAEDKLKAEMKAAEEEKERMLLQEELNSEMDKDKEKKKKDVFAKFKSYNKNNTKSSASVSAPSNNISKTNIKKDEKVVLKDKANRYNYEGKIVNYSFLKKVDKKAVNKRLGLSFAEFKKMNLEYKK